MGSGALNNFIKFILRLSHLVVDHVDNNVHTSHIFSVFNTFLDLSCLQRPNWTSYLEPTGT